MSPADGPSPLQAVAAWLVTIETISRVQWLRFREPRQMSEDEQKELQQFRDLFVS